MGARFNALALTGVLLAGVEGCSGPVETPHAVAESPASQQPTTGAKSDGEQSSGLDIYLATWDAEGVDRQETASLLERHAADIGRLTVAFTTFDSKGSLIPVDVSDGLQAELDAVPNAPVFIAAGGASQSANGLKKAEDNPKKAAKSAASVAKAFERATGRAVAGFQIDVEPPEDADPDDLTKLVAAFDSELSDDYELSAAVPAWDNAAVDTEAIAEHVDGLTVMTVDKDGPWSEKAGAVATVKWLKENVRDIIERTGPNGPNITAEAAAYCYSYPGANRPGDDFDNDASEKIDGIPYSLLSKKQKTAAAKNSGWVQINGNLSTCFTPEQVKGSLAGKDLADVGLSIWTSSGLTEEYLDAATEAHS